MSKTTHSLKVESCITSVVTNNNGAQKDLYIRKISFWSRVSVSALIFTRKSLTGEIHVLASGFSKYIFFKI